MKFLLSNVVAATPREAVRLLFPAGGKSGLGSPRNYTSGQNRIQVKRIPPDRNQKPRPHQLPVHRIRRSDDFHAVFQMTGRLFRRRMRAGRAIPIHTVEDLQQQQKNNGENCPPPAAFELFSNQIGFPPRRSKYGRGNIFCNHQSQ